MTPAPLSDFRASLPRVLAALGAGALTGGVLVSITQFGAVHLGLGGSHYGGTVAGLVVTAMAGSVLYGAGLGVISPVWLLLHRTGHRRPWAAVLLGAAMSVLAAILAVALTSASSHRPPPVPDAQTVLLFLLPLAVIGAIVGLVIWRTAYRRLG